MVENMLKDYGMVALDVKYRIKEKCKGMNCGVVLTSRASLHPGDSHLYVVLAKNIKPRRNEIPYVVWYYNDSTGALVEGVYDVDFKIALEAYVKKLI